MIDTIVIMNRIWVTRCKSKYFRNTKALKEYIIEFFQIWVKAKVILCLPAKTKFPV